MVQNTTNKNITFVDVILVILNPSPRDLTDFQILVMALPPASQMSGERQEAISQNNNVILLNNKTVL